MHGPFVLLFFFPNIIPARQFCTPDASITHACCSSSGPHAAPSDLTPARLITSTRTAVSSPPIASRRRLFLASASPPASSWSLPFASHRRPVPPSPPAGRPLFSLRQAAQLLVPRSLLCQTTRHRPATTVPPDYPCLARPYQCNRRSSLPPNSTLPRPDRTPLHLAPARDLPCSADLAPTYVLSSPVPDQLRSLCTPPTPTCDSVLTNRICLPYRTIILCFSDSLTSTCLYFLRLLPFCSPHPRRRLFLASASPPASLHLGLLHTAQPRLPSQPGFPASCSLLALILKPPFPPPASLCF